jgi:hypothetical protein
VLPGEYIEVFSEHHHPATILCGDVDFQVRPMMADSVVGKRFTGYAPHNFVVKIREASASTLRTVHLITVRTSTN